MTRRLAQLTLAAAGVTVLAAARAPDGPIIEDVGAALVGTWMVASLLLAVAVLV